MQTIKIEIHNIESLEGITKLLESNNSGFQVTAEKQLSDFHKPLKSMIGDIATLTGTVINAAQLIVTLLYWRSQKKENENKPPSVPEIFIITTEGKVAFNSDNGEEVEAILRKYQVEP